MKKILSSTKGKIIAGAATLVVIVAVVIVVILLNTGYRSIRVEDLDGTTKVTAESGVIEAFEGQNLKDGYKVRVLEDSSLTLALDSDKHVFADELTKFRIEAVGVAGKDSRTVIRLEKGSVLNKIDNKLLPSESYVVESPNASMSVRGTVFSVKVFYDDEGFCHTVVEVSDGVVEFTEKGTDNKESKTLNAGEKAEVISLVDKEDDEKPTESSANSSSGGNNSSADNNSGVTNSLLTSGDFKYMYNETLGGIEIVGYIGKDEIVNVPAEIDGKRVVKIGRSTFMSSKITSVTIPNVVKEIGESAFEKCRELTSITIPNGVEVISYGAFMGCSSLKSITIPDSVKMIEKNVFWGCTVLSNVTIPDSVTQIGGYAFAFCYGLKSITIPDKVTVIGEGAFSCCSGLTSVTIPDSVTVIGNSAFSNCDELTSITISDNVTVIGDGAFCGCYRLTNVTIPNSVTKIGRDLFSGCQSLTTVTIPDSVTEIGEYAFRLCNRITSIEIPDSVTVIGKNAFSDCKATITYKGNTYTPDNYSELYTV